MLLKKVKIQGVKLEVDLAIKRHTSVLGLFNSNLPDFAQCSGYQSFKNLVLVKNKIDFFSYEASHIHPNIRKKLLTMLYKLEKI